MPTGRFQEPRMEEVLADVGLQRDEDRAVGVVLH